MNYTSMKRERKVKTGNRAKSVVIAGAGLVGSLLALYLARRDYEVRVYEKRPDARKAELSGGRSINLALSRRGWKALEKAGVADKVRAVALPMKGRLMHDLEGQTVFQPYGKDDQAIFSVPRGELNRILLEAADQHANVAFRFDQRIEGIDFESKQIMSRNGSGSVVAAESYDLLIGADGAFSAVRQRMMKADRFSYQQNYIAHGYKELSIPPTASGGFALDPEALHIWPRKRFMLIALPNPDQSFTATLFFPYEGAPSFDSLNNEERIRAFFDEQFPDAVPLMPDLMEEYHTNPTASLVTIRCSPWTRGDSVMLIGDAAHAIVPFYGQGMNSGFEDVYVLDGLRDVHDDEWDDALPRYRELREADGNAIADLALYNFVEMRDRVADPEFLLRKKIEARMHEQHPDKWVPLYSMVTFSDLRYSEAQALGKRQDAIMAQILALDGIEDRWPTMDFTEYVLQFSGQKAETA